MSQIAVSGIAVEYGARTIFEAVTFTVNRGERWGIIGRNGTGKTSLFNVIVGRLTPARGSVSRASGLRMTLLDQHRETGEDLTAWQAAALPFAELITQERSLEELAHRIGELGEQADPALFVRYDHELEQFARAGGYSFAARVDAVLQGLGFDPAMARTQPVRQLSGGEAGRIALARQLVAPADVLLLDEPTNHLDLDTTAWLEQYLANLDASVLVISHDRAFLQRVIDHVLHLEHGRAVAYRGSYNSFVQQYTERRMTRQRAYEAQQRMIAAEQDYIRRNIAGQNTRQAKGRRKRLARLDRLSPPPGEAGTMAMQLRPQSRGGDQVLVARGVRLTVGPRVLIDDFSSRVTRGEVVGLVGANGTGKSTLLQTIAGLRPIEAGELKVGESIVVAYYRQDLSQIPLDKTLFDIIHDLRPLWQRGSVQSHLGRFGFSGDEAQRKADSLSGGERARVALAMLVLSEAHFLLMDEPTNHLDVESIEALEDALEAYDGTVLLVSHDRELLRNTVTRVWFLEAQQISDYAGGFDEWEELQAQQRASANRQTQDEKSERRESERVELRRRYAATASDRATIRSLRAAVAAAEAEVHALEARAAELRAVLENPATYGDAESVRRATDMKRELDDVEEALVLAIERWTNAAEALDSRTPA